ncbi:hypothetical protein GCM10011361_07880 [Muriicola marianensis]|uniref:Uncharacterized protein n=2 Tax=Muriicola marianensis TaxID=1324801 RepID=A0ABQ1QUX5_9FLAO|nr:hypothetical protein GCM10011361_07880 [Muriicola marianensis]
MMTENISRLHGLVWLFTAGLFMVSLVLYLIRSESWSWVGLAGVILSQILIVISWTDAKHGTWINLLLLIPLITALSEMRFNSMTECAVEQLYSTNESILDENSEEAPLHELPGIVTKWIDNSGIQDLGEIRKVHLRQKGQMRLTPDGRWMSFSAEQWFNSNEPGFVWKTKVDAFGPIFLSGRDQLITERASMNISLLSSIPVVSESEDPKLTQATMTRFLAEICWFPSAALHPYLVWESIDEYTARATFRDHPEVSGVFHFDPHGQMVSFEALRYRDSGEHASLEPWSVRNTSFKQFGPVKLPNKSEVCWITDEREFHWLNLEITEIDYN